jgi:hypothetical protein
MAVGVAVVADETREAVLVFAAEIARFDRMGRATEWRRHARVLGEPFSTTTPIGDQRDLAIGRAAADCPDQQESRERFAFDHREVSVHG